MKIGQYAKDLISMHVNQAVTSLVTSLECWSIIQWYPSRGGCGNYSILIGLMSWHTMMSGSATTGPHAHNTTLAKVSVGASLSCISYLSSGGGGGGPRPKGVSHEDR